LSFGAPLFLLFLLLVPAAVLALRWLDERRTGRAGEWASPALLPNMVDAAPVWPRRIPVILLLAGVTLLLVGFARPKATFSFKKQEATVVIVLDVSGSMAAKDSTPTRLAAAKAVALEYVDRLPKGYRMSVLTFSDHDAVAAAPTHDLDHVRAVIANAKTGPQGTALADAVAHAVDVARTVRGPKAGAERPPAVVVVLSDGGQTAGRVTPQQAAQKAKQARIPVTAVGLGTPDGIVEQKLKGGFVERIQVPAQPAVLQTIARTSHGRYYAGAAAADVKATYSELGSRVGHKDKRVEITAAAAAGGIAFMLAGAVLSGAWFRRFP
jgi:Ca-activated chloride channel family protein